MRAVGSTLWFAVPEKPVEAAQAALEADEAEVEEQPEGPAEEEEQPEEPAKEEEQPEGPVEVEEQPEGPAEEESQAVTPPPVQAPAHETAEDLPKVCSFCTQAEFVCGAQVPIV